MLSDAERRELMAIARAAIAARAGARSYTTPEVRGSLGELAGAFVTIRRGETLRGCIGYTQRDRPLAEVVARCAGAAASEDPRFPPISDDELPRLDVEISVLGPLEPVADPDQIEVGRHGILVEDGFHRGLLLPQVATEWGWDRETFLTHTCMKAGLPPDAWKTGTRLFRFEAEVFGDE